MESTQDLNGFDGGAREVWGNFVSDARKTHYLDLQPLTRGQRAFEIGAAEILQTEHQRSPGDGALDLVAMHGKLIADRGPDEIGAIRIEAFLD